MNAGRDLTEAYQEWHRLAEAEGQAIGARDWGLVSACQRRSSTCRNEFHR